MKPLLNISSAELQGLGIVGWGYTTETRPLSHEVFTRWLASNEASLPFLGSEKNINYRSDLKQWWPEAKSALVFLFTYAPTKKALLEAGDHRVAGYTLGFDGEDYHAVMKARLHAIAHRLQEAHAFTFKHSHDTEPIMERDLAFRAGLGWFGKNSLMINRQLGSYFMIGSLILDQLLPLEVAPSVPDHCGTCRACVDACPTLAIDPETRTLRAEDCISTWTIENRSAEASVPVGMEKARGEVFGCDICQDVCPWNQRALQAVTAHLGEGSRKWLSWFKQDWGEMASEVSWMTNRGFLRFMEGTPFGRPGRPAFLRTLAFWMKKKD